jgi:hypothetical protein
MKSKEALQVLAGLSAAQWGMLTSAQAAKRGVSRLELTRLANAGHLERVAHGVYKDSGVPGDPFEGLRAFWLSVKPNELAEQRVARRQEDVIVSGATASWLHGVGDLWPEPFEFTTMERRQSQRRGLRYRIRNIPEEQVTVVHGLPVTTVERTIADLVESNTDPSLVADVFASAVTRGVDLAVLAELLDPLAARNGHARNDGHALLASIQCAAHIDADAISEQLVGTPLGQLIASEYLSHIARERILPPEFSQGMQVLARELAESARKWEPTTGEITKASAMSSALLPSPALLAASRAINKQLNESGPWKSHARTLAEALKPHTQQLAAASLSEANASLAAAIRGDRQVTDVPATSSARNATRSGASAAAEEDRCQDPLSTAQGELESGGRCDEEEAATHGR